MTQIKHLGVPKQVLGFIANKVALGVMLNDTGITADANGKKIIPAGTPVGGTSSTLEDEQAVLSVANDATAQGVLEFAADVTGGQGNGTMIVNGFVNELRFPDGVTVSDEAKKALDGKVTFFKRNGGR